MEQNGDSLLLGISAPFFRDADGRIHVERQTILGLNAWAEHFSAVTAFSICRDENPPLGWVDAGPEGILTAGIELVPLPDTYDIKVFLTQRRRISEKLSELMRGASYRSFAYGGWIGDPGEIAAATARRQGLSHAVWFDRVESQLAGVESSSSLRARAKARVRAAIFRFHENRAVRRADLSLLHEATVFNHFYRYARNPQQVEDVHFTEAERAGPDFVEAKAAQTGAGPLRIVYCGRAAAMKGPFDWIEVLAGLKRAKVAFTARWLGDGELLDEMRAVIDRHGLGPDELILEGFVDDVEEVRQAYRDAHIMLFCHLSDESPRNLIESLHSATPIVGYGDPYAASLVQEKGAGLLVPRYDVAALVEGVAGLDADRGALSALIRRAGESASRLTLDSVFRHRSDIIRRELGPGAESRPGRRR